MKYLEMFVTYLLLVALYIQGLEYKAYKTDKGFLYWEFIKDYFEIVFFILVYLFGMIFIFFPHAVKAGYLYSRDLLKRKKL